MTRPPFTQRYTNVAISGLASIDAPHRVTSEQIEEQLEPVLEKFRIPRGMLARVVGVQERRFWDRTTTPSAAATMAAEKVLANTGIDREDIGLLVSTSVSRDYVEPATASIIHGALHLPFHAANFDVGNACLGFLSGMNIASAMIERREIDHALIVCGEQSRGPVESTIARILASDSPQVFREQFATLTLGSGAVAMVLSHADATPASARYLGGLSRSGTEHALLCTAQANEMRTDTKGLLEAGVEVGQRTWADACSSFGWTNDSFDLYAVHQVSLVHTRAICHRLGLDQAKFPLIFPTYGNIGPASVPIVLANALADGTITTGSRTALMGIGSGVNAIAAEVVW